MLSRQVWRDEFRLKNFGYQHPDKTAFYRCMWKWPKSIFLIIRIILALYAVYGFTHELVQYYRTAVDHSLVHSETLNTNISTTKLASLTSNDTSVLDNTVSPEAKVTTTELTRGHQVNQGNREEGKRSNDDDADWGWDTRRPWWAFYTLWSYTVIMVHLVLAAVLAALFHRSEQGITSYTLETPGTGQDNMVYDVSMEEVRTSEAKITEFVAVEDQSKDDGDKTTPWYLQLSWLLSDLITPTAPIVTTAYFAFMAPSEPPNIFNTNVHVLNTGLILLDQLVSARPVRLLHAPAAMLFGLLYNLFNYIFWTFDHKEHVVYPGVVDWNHPMSSAAVVLLMVMVATPILNVFWFLFYRFKMWLYSRVYGG